MLTKPRFLVHFALERVLFANLDALGERGFAVMIFHLVLGVLVEQISAKLSAKRI